MRRKLPTLHEEGEEDDDVHNGDGAAAYLRRRVHRWWSLVHKRSLTSLSRTASLLLLICLALLLVAWVQSARSLTLHHQGAKAADLHSAAMLLDGKAIAKLLPRVFPNGATGVHRCDLLSLRYQCDMNASAGCQAYPQLFPMGDLLRNWSPDEPSRQPEQIFSSICRFNLSTPYELELAQVFHQMEVPFIAYGIPALSRASVQWTDECPFTHTLVDQQYLTTQLKPTELYKVHVANNSHFMYYSKSMAKLDEPPTYASKWWTYPQFLEAVASTISDNIKQERRKHPYYYLMLKAQDIRTRASFIYKDLDFLDPSRSSPLYRNLFIRDAQDALSRGLRCRLGMQGIITEGHFDAGLNMIAMVRGAKRYILSPPSVCSCLGLLTSGASARHTSLDWSNVSALPSKALSCPATEVVVQAGDVLYVPSYWYHHIVSLDESVQCNVRSGVILRDDVKGFLDQCGFAKSS